MAGSELVSEPKQATSRQRSAFSDAVEILNELQREGISASQIIIAMEHSGQDITSAGSYLMLAGLYKMTGEETE